jgi:hypothetical protein
MGNSKVVHEQYEQKLAELLRARDWYLERIDQVDQGLRKGNSAALRGRLIELDADIGEIKRRIAAIGARCPPN